MRSFILIQIVSSCLYQWWITWQNVTYVKVWNRTLNWSLSKMFKGISSYLIIKPWNYFFSFPSCNCCHLDLLKRIIYQQSICHYLYLEMFRKALKRTYFSCPWFNYYFISFNHELLPFGWRDIWFKLSWKSLIGFYNFYIWYNNEMSYFSDKSRWIHVRYEKIYIEQILFANIM